MMKLSKNKKTNFKISLHPLFIILGIILAVMGELELFLITTFSALLHEMGHYIVANKLRYQMTKVRLMPFGAELFGDFDSFDSRDEIYIAIAGPIVNFIICLLILSLWWINPGIYNLTYSIFTTNIAMGLFNLMPIFPLDGGRIILCMLSQKQDRKQAARLVKNITKTFAIFLFCGFLISCFTKINLSFGIMAFLLFFTASSNFKDATYQKINLKDLVKKKNVEWVFMSIPDNTPLYKLKKIHIKNKVIQFLVMDERFHISFSVNELELEDVFVKVDITQELKNIKDLLFNNNNNYMFIIDKNKIM